MELKVEVEQLGPVERRLSVTVPRQRVEEALEERYRDLRRRVQLRGFRPGRAPRFLLERLYGEQVRSEVMSQLLGETYQRALQERGLEALGGVQIERMELQGEFTYVARLEVPPELGPIDWRGLEVTVRLPSLEEALRDRLEELRESYARLEEVDRPASPGDWAVVDLVGVSEGQEVERADNYLLELTQEAHPRGLGPALVGATAGQQREVELSFPPDYPREDLAGRTVRYRVRVRGVRQRVLPELDDELARDAGYEGLEQLMATLRDSLQRQREERLAAEARRLIAERLLELQGEVPLPPSLVEREAKRLAAEREGLPGEVREEAERSVRRWLILRALAAQEGIAVEERDREAAYRERADRWGWPVERVRALFQSDEEAREELERALLERKVLDFLRERVRLRVEEG